MALIKKKTLFFFILFGILIFGVVGVSIGLEPFEISEDTIYITPNTLIKNFDLDTFDDSVITPSGITSKYEDSLKFEQAESWTASKSDIEVLQSYLVNNTVYLQYLLTAKTKINIYTNVRLDQASQNPLIPVTEEFEVGTFEYRGLFGDAFVHWDSFIDWTHYDFGDVWAHNFNTNQFSGTLTMTFDIAQNPLPISFTDADGNLLVKNFDYITIYSAGIAQQSIGDLSADMPTLVGLIPSEYDTEVNKREGGTTQGDMVGFEYTWDPNPRIEHLILNTFEPGIQAPSVGASLNPTTKDGGPTWNAKDTEQSMTDCKLYYHIGSIAPYVVEYGSRLTYDHQEIVVQDELVGIVFVVPVYEPRLQYDREELITETRPTGLHVTNRFIQTEITVRFEFWSAYSFDIVEVDTTDLEDPEEYYDDIIWDTLVDGAGGGKTYVSSWDGIFTPGTTLTLILIAVIGITVIVVVYRIYRKKSQMIYRVIK